MSDSRPFAARRDGSGPVTCATCGCRLQPTGAAEGDTYVHFGAIGGRDARGCRVSCVDLAHDPFGQPAGTHLA